LPHSRDEIYVVAQGSGEFVCGAARQLFSHASCLPRPNGASF
jgi:mannose-6-phosphate isomerase-like protein (cupin superfamily)